MSGQQRPRNKRVRTDVGNERWRTLGICLALAAMTFAVFGQTLRHGFINYDDNTYVYENPVVTQGLTLKGIAWFFSHSYYNLYHPLTMLSLMADYQLHGFNAGGYHLTNVLLHTASVILLFLILRQMTGALWRSAFVAAVFAVHPLRVESVAWVAERKDVLSAFFFMLTLGAYVRHVRKPNSLGRYLAVDAAFVLALLSKPTVVMLPFVLLLLDYWPLQRKEPAGRLMVEKLPLLALAAGICVINFLAGEKLIGGLNQIPFSARLGNAVVSYGVYLRQMVWPDGLALHYPFPRHGAPAWSVTLAGAMLAGLSAAAWRGRRTRPWFLIGWLWYLGMLVPMIGLMQVGSFAHADRFSYLPQVGIYVAVTWWVAEWRVSRAILGGLMAGALAALMVCAWQYTTCWQDSETLWNHALACTTDNHVAHINLGNALLQKGQVENAIVQYQEVLKIQPNYADAHYNLGNALLKKGAVDESIDQFQQALQINPTIAEACINLGNALLQKGRVDEATAQFEQALQINPASVEAHDNFGHALLQKGKVDEAIA